MSTGKRPCGLEDRRGLAGFGDVAVLGLQRQACLCPADDPALQRAASKPARAQRLGRHRRAVAAAAVEDDRAVLVDLAGLGGSSSSGEVAGAGDVARLPLVVGAHVDQLDLAVASSSLFGLAARSRPLLALGAFARSPSVDVGALDQEGDAHVGAVLVEVLAADPGRDDVDGADVAQRALRLVQRLLAASSVDVFELPTSSMIFTTAT